MLSSNQKAPIFSIFGEIRNQQIKIQ